MERTGKHRQAGGRGRAWWCRLWAAGLTSLTSLTGPTTLAGTVYELAPLEVEAWHFGVGARSIPADVTRLDGEALEALGASSVVDLLRREANLELRSVTGVPGTGELAMRGFGENSGLRVLVLVDGLKANRPDMGGLEWQQLPVEEIESVEVIRGGQTVLYGSHAVSGVVKLRTRKGGTRRAGLRATVGGDGYERAHLSGSGSAGRAYYRFGLNHFRDEGMRENTLSRSRSAQASGGYAFGERDDLSLRLSWSDHYRQFPGPLTWEQYREDPEASFNGGGQFSRSLTERGSVRWQARRDWGQLEVDSGFSRSRLQWDLDGTYAANEQRAWGASPRVRIGNGERFLMVAGDLLLEELDFTDYLGRDREIVQARADLERLTGGLAVFGQQPLREGLTLSGGIRLERARTDYLYEKYDPAQINPLDPVIWDPQRPNPNYQDPPDIVDEASADEVLSQDGLAAEFSVNWELSPALRVWAGYDRVYRYPVLDEVAAYQGYPLEDPVNRDLDPEEGNQWEAGLQWTEENWHLALTAYHLRMEDEIAFDDTLNLNTNIGPTRRTGVDLALGQSWDRFGWKARWSLVEARLAAAPFDGRTVPLVPWQHGTLAIWYQPVPALRIELDYQVTGRRYQGGDYANGARELPAHGLVGVRISADLSPELRLDLKVRNLFDTDHVSTAFNGGYYPGTGRRFELSLRYTL